MGIAKPIPSTLLFAIFEEVMPMTSPLPLSSGPPELPGLIEASVWIRVMAAVLPLESSAVISFSRPDIIPPEAESPKPRG